MNTKDYAIKFDNTPDDMENVKYAIKQYKVNPMVS